jgi:hypothetical protein
LPHVGGIAGHAAAWGDVDGDGFPELYVGTFAQEDSKPNMLFRSMGKGKFQLDEQKSLQVSGRAGGAVFADLDNDGDLDLYLSNLSGGKSGYQASDSRLWRNDGNGKFEDISKPSGACPAGFRGRSVCVLDFDGDGLLDLLLGEGVYYGSPRRSRLMKNLGGLKFADVSEEAGLPAGVPGLGVAAGDINGDTWPDIFLAARDGGNRLFLNNGKGRFRPLPDGDKLFAWQYETGDDSACGVAFGDVNRDGLVDLVIGQHYKRPWLSPVPVRLYLNTGIRDGNPKLVEATTERGLVPLPMKAPHVEIQDFDNDGYQDIYVSMVKFAGGAAHPVIFKNPGRDRSIKFHAAALAVNDFPTDEDRAETQTGEFFDRMIRQQQVIYMAPGPTADFDRDGRLDIFLCNWWSQSPSLLLRNETPGGHWLQVTVDGGERINRMGIGCRVNIYAAGKLGEKDALLGTKEIAVGYGYASGQEAVAHLGLGEVETCDVEIVLPHGKGVVTRENVAADQRLKVEL